jgi:gamma-glutamyl-gamma-aminobutyrate hydrolase PuuD
VVLPFAELDKAVDIPRHFVKESVPRVGLWKPAHFMFYTKHHTKYMKIKTQCTNVRIGVVTSPMPVGQMHKAESYIDNRYLEWVEMSGATAVVISYMVDDVDVYLNSVQGVVLCGGGVENKKTHTTAQYEKYSRLCQRIYAFAAAKPYYPLWGTCLGFEFLCMMGSGDPLAFEPANIQKAEKNTLSTLQFTGPSKLRALFTEAELEEMATTPFCAHVHRYGFLIDAPHTKRMQRFLNIISVDRTDDGAEYVNMVEFKTKPFYGAIWHPEKLSADHRSFPLSLAVAEKFSRFFKAECAKNKMKVTPVFKNPSFHRAHVLKNPTAFVVKGGAKNNLRTTRKRKRTRCRSSRRNA